MNNDLQEETHDLLRAHGKESILALAESHGLKATHGRLKCAWDCIGDKRGLVSIHTGKHGIDRMVCHRCGNGGTYADLLMALTHCTFKDACEKMRGAPLAPRPRLSIVRAEPVTPKDKLTPGEVKKLWDAMARGDEKGEAYLEERALAGAMDLSLVRFATEEHPDHIARGRAKGGRRMAMLMSDVLGNPRGIQYRLVRHAQSKEEKILSHTGGTNAWFGHPELIESAETICVCEGMADTLAVALWAESHLSDHLTVIGAPGKDALPKLTDQLKATGISVEGKAFMLFVQNDRPKNLSRQKFDLLRQSLTKAGALVVMVATHPEFQDFADWRKADSSAPWPPPEFARFASGDEADEDTVKYVAGPGGTQMPEQFSSPVHSKGMETLAAFLDDPSHRASIMGPGNLALNVMNQAVFFNNQPMTDAGITVIKIGLEQYARTSEGKPLRFSSEEIREALFVVASRHPFHPIRDWLTGLKWDGTHRIDMGLPVALGQQQGELPALLVRRWLIGAVARALRPGIKMENVLVLVGAQGVGKSTFFSIMGGKWFTDEAVNLADKDSKMILARSWILEWAELESMRRARDQEAIKAFLSQQIDLFRPPYGRDLIEVERTCVIVGTTNNREFLSDPSGNRRFWPVDVPSVDQNWVRENRDQLWAEAVSAFLTGEQHWLEPEAEAFLAKQHEEFIASDPWEDLVGDYLIGRTEITPALILENVIKKPAGQWTKSDTMRVSAILKHEGWRRVQKRVGGGRSWVYVRDGAVTVSPTVTNPPIES